MKHIFTLFTMVLLTINCIGQTTGDASLPKPQLPEVIPPSPTVAALMKFEEVNVDNYSGIPDVNIPFFSSSLGGPSLDIKLSYHPNNANANAAASDCGLGWSLMAGGTISRTVRGGSPDEYMEPSTTIYNDKKVGIYRSLNPFYDIYNQIVAGTMNLDTDYYNNFLWETVVRSKFDTEHDLYQYNFLGYTGRFIIRKIGTALQVEKLDTNPLVITNNYNTSDYTPNSFVITDQYGYKYTFDIIETSTASTFSATTSSVPGRLGLISGSTSYTYRSAFHLSNVTDSNGVIKMQLEYEDTGKQEIFIAKSVTYAKENGGQQGYNTMFSENQDYQPLPFSQSNSSQNTTITRKLNRILLPGKAKINFNFTLGRSDTNLHNPSNSYKLSDITVTDWNDQVVKHFNFNYSYSNIIYNRMMLSQVRDYDQAGATYLKQDISYYGFEGDLSLKAIDYWGYFTARPFYSAASNGIYREPSSTLCKADLLNKITLSTGGCKVFNFESNTYSYIGDQPLDNFDDNPDNWSNETRSQTFSHSENNSTKFLFDLQREQDIYLLTNNNFGSSGITDWFFALKKLTGTVYTDVGGINSYSYCASGTCYQKIHLLPGSYYVQYSTGQEPVAGQNFNYTAGISVYYRDRLLDGDGVHGTPEKKYLYGGGVRIGSIAYYDTGVVNESTIPKKKVDYNYSFFSNSYKSSGSLVYVKPRFYFVKDKRECVKDLQYATSLYDFSLNYSLETTTNLLSPAKTKGADVGYQQVTVGESGNGRSEYEYTSAIDYPEFIDDPNTSFPYLPTLNIDHKRGLLKKMRAYSEGGLKLKEISNDYEIEEYVSESGLRNAGGADYTFRNYSNYTTYSNFKDYIVNCRQYSPSTTCPNGGPHAYDFDCNCFCYEPEPKNWAFYTRLKEAYGTARVTQTLQDEFYYNGNVLSGTVHKTTAYVYNLTNKEVKQKTTSSSMGPSMVEKFYFADESALNAEPNIATIRSRHMINIPLMTETYYGADLTQRQKTLYKDFGAGLLYPELIQTQKKDGPLENRIHFNKYDANGNLLEVQQENGTKICYIWGYDGSVPVAKIENMDYANILPATLISDIVTASSSTGTESQLLTKLDALRTAPALATAQVTTFTYKPQVGPSIITDPKGDRMNYSYDTFGRLVKITDRNGNILSENEYHYKN